MNREELEEAITSAIAKSNTHTCYPEEHKEFVSAWIAKENRRQELWQSVKKHTITWALIGALGYIGMVVWDDLKHQFNGNPVVKKPDIRTNETKTVP